MRMPLGPEKKGTGSKHHHQQRVDKSEKQKRMWMVGEMNARGQEGESISAGEKTLQEMDRRKQRESQRKVERDQNGL